jgi:pimeloyl-ACP methyl ester carboxylesterase
MGLAYEIHGDGVPVLFLHGLTFDRTTWRPIIERLGGNVRSIAVDLPAHGESGGSPAPLEEVAALLHDLAVELGAERPVVVGHSMAAGIALIYGGTYPARGVVMVDSGPDVREFGALIKQLEPALRSDAFAAVFERFRESMGIDLLLEPMRTQVHDAQRVEQDVVLGYWDQLLRVDLEQFQAQIDEHLAGIRVPILAVFGHPVAPGDRNRLALAADVEIDEHPGEGHFVHLADPERFASRLRAFVDRCAR